MNPALILDTLDIPQCDEPEQSKFALSKFVREHRLNNVEVSTNPDRCVAVVICGLQAFTQSLHVLLWRFRRAKQLCRKVMARAAHLLVLRRESIGRALQQLGPSDSGHEQQRQGIAALYDRMRCAWHQKQRRLLRLWAPAHRDCCRLRAAEMAAGSPEDAKAARQRRHCLQFYLALLEGSCFKRLDFQPRTDQVGVWSRVMLTSQPLAAAPAPAPRKAAPGDRRASVARHSPSRRQSSATSAPPEGERGEGPKSGSPASAFRARVRAGVAGGVPPPAPSSPTRGRLSLEAAVVRASSPAPDGPTSPPSPSPGPSPTSASGPSPTSASGNRVTFADEPPGSLFTPGSAWSPEPRRRLSSLKPSHADAQGSLLRRCSTAVVCGTGVGQGRSPGGMTMERRSSQADVLRQLQRAASREAASHSPTRRQSQAAPQRGAVARGLPPRTKSAALSPASKSGSFMIDGAEERDPARCRRRALGPPEAAK